MSSVAENSFVRDRIDEIEVAHHEQARTAARRGDWDTVDQIINLAKQAAQKSPGWIGSIQALEKYAKLKEQERFIKRLCIRLTICESVSSTVTKLSIILIVPEAEKLGYLRRKTERGKRL